MAIVAIMTAAALGFGQPAPAAAVASAAPVACSAPTPAAGEVVAGPVLQVIDGRTLCVAQGPVPSQWVRLTLADDSAANDRASLEAAVFAKRLVCTVSRRDAGGAVARCAADAGSASGIGRIQAVAPAPASTIDGVCRTID